MEEEVRALEAIREAEATLQDRFARTQEEAARIVADARKEAARLIADADQGPFAPSGDEPFDLPDIPSPPLPPELAPLIDRLADEIHAALLKEAP